ncbi:MAG: hypothetical protein Q8R57_12700, partial [Bacteroidota bacterium]|nr:hypothetical protein [Bacteroidota bacterium]
PTGFVELSGDNTTGSKIRIGNADISLTASHTIGMCIEVDKAILASFSGNLPLITTTQLSGANPYLQFFIGGGSHGTSAYRNNYVMQRAGMPSGVPGLMTEYGTSNNGIGQAVTPYGYNGNTNNPSTQFIWLWILGRSTSDPVTNEQTLAYNGGSSNYHPNNCVLVANAIHGSSSSLQLNLRKVNAPAYGAASITPDALTNIDFVIGASSNATAKTWKLARFIKLNRAASVAHLATMSGGVHPKSLGYNTTGDLCLDFNTIPANCTVIQGSVAHNTNENSPIMQRYHGDNTSDNNLVITNGRVV